LLEAQVGRNNPVTRPVTSISNTDSDSKGTTK